jgi:hypothetical protein
MPRKYLAFDIETAKSVPGTDFNWKPHRPLGICCAAALACDAREAVLWHGKESGGSPARQLSPAEAREVVGRLSDWVADGYTLLTWNGLGFDLNILAEESALLSECRQLALQHVDAMFHVFCALGYPVGLEKAAQALKIPGKPPGMSGELAPQLWEQGRHQEVLRYVAQDVRMTLQVAQKSEERLRFDWLTRRGTSSSMALPQGWLPVGAAAKLPLPDTSWMTHPIPRTEFTAWLGI